MAMGHPMTLDASLQRVIRAPASRVLTAMLFPNDPYFNVRGDESAQSNDSQGTTINGCPVRIDNVDLTVSFLAT